MVYNAMRVMVLLETSLQLRVPILEQPLTTLDVNERTRLRCAIYRTFTDRRHQCTCRTTSMRESMRWVH